MAEKVHKVGLVREAGYLYFIIANVAAVLATLLI
jgi:hypothetical protein